jgi:predicted dienelactone hydrolase
MDKTMNSMLIIIIFLLMGYSYTSYAGEQVFQDKERDRNIRYKLWMPKSRSPVPLVVVSHGSEGEYPNHKWLISSLVENQYAVLALNHPKNTSRNRTKEGVIRVWDRPMDISRLLDYVLIQPETKARINADRIVAAGFSSGGYTVLALAGAIYNPEQMKAYCAGQSRGNDCDLAEEKLPDKIDYSAASNNYRDPRIKAVFAMAPAVGPAITQQSLEAINVPVYIMAAQNDEILEPTLHAQYYARHTPNAKLELLSDGGHFLFLQCSLTTRIADWFIKDFELCKEKGSQPRKTVWPSISSTAYDFFSASLNDYP